MFFIQALPAGSHPVEIVREPAFHPGSRIPIEHSSVLEQCHALGGVDQGDRVDDPGAAPCVVAAHRLPELQIGIHPGFRIEEPGGEYPRGMLAAASVAQQSASHAEGEQGGAEIPQVAAIAHEALGVPLAVFADVGTAGVLGIRPPIGPLAIVIVWSRRHVVRAAGSYAPRPRPKRSGGIFANNGGGRLEGSVLTEHFADAPRLQPRYQNQRGFRGRARGQGGRRDREIELPACRK